jgi:hypothetical protein
MRRLASAREVIVARGHDAVLRLVVCADPRPRRASWEWGSMQLESGAALGRYRAEELDQVSLFKNTYYLNKCLFVTFAFFELRKQKNDKPSSACTSRIYSLYALTVSIKCLKFLVYFILII